MVEGVAPGGFGISTHDSNGVPLALPCNTEHYFRIPSYEGRRESDKVEIRTTYYCNGQKRTKRLILQGDKYPEDKDEKM